MQAIQDMWKKIGVNVELQSSRMESIPSNKN